MMNVRYGVAAVVLGLSGSFVILAPAFAEPAVYTGRFSNLAIQGHDPVAYFIEGKPVKGVADFEIEYQGAKMRFASAANRDAFLANPDAYAPQYGGYCAWAMADGKYAKGDADHWRIVEGKLYLNYNSGVQEKWNKNIPQFIESADIKWKNITE